MTCDLMWRRFPVGAAGLAVMVCVILMAAGPAWASRTIEVPVAVDGYMWDDRPADGVFDRLIGSQSQLRADNLGDSYSRVVLEFSLPALLPGEVVAGASFEVTQSVLTSPYRDLELHGYAGDGVLAISDAYADNLIEVFPPQGGRQQHDVTAHLRALYSGGEDYAGLMIKSAVEGEPEWTQAFFRSSEYDYNPDLRPELVLTIVPEPSMLGLVMLGGLGVVIRRRRG